MKSLQEKPYLARFLDRLMLKNGSPAKEMASKMGIVKSHLSQILNGQRRSFNFETVAKMVEGVSEDPKVQGEFLKNYLLDQCTDENRELIKVIVKGSEEDTSFASASLSPDAVDLFYSHLRNLKVPETTLNIFRKLLDQADNSDALLAALANLADLEIPTKRSRAGEGDWRAHNREAMEDSFETLAADQGDHNRLDPKKPTRQSPKDASRSAAPGVGKRVSP